MGSATDKKKIMMIAAGASCLALGAIAIFTFIPKSNQDYLHITGLPDNATIDITLEQKGSTRALSHERIEGDAHVLSPDNLPTGDYILTATVNEGGKYKDIRYLVNRGTGHVIMAASGFMPKEPFSFAQKSGLHFDWNGRIELEQSLSVKNPAPLCLETDSGLSICHRAGRA